MFPIFLLQMLSGVLYCMWFCNVGFLACGCGWGDSRAEQGCRKLVWKEFLIRYNRVVDYVLEKLQF